MKSPHLIEFDKIGNSAIGFISVTDNFSNVPFEIKRVYWTYFTPEEVERGRHAHFKTEQILIAVSGKIIVQIEFPGGNCEVYILDKPNLGLYVPPNCWHTMQYSHSSVQLVLSSTLYDEGDYIRDYKTFKKVYPK